MDASASSAYARKRLAQLPGLNQKIQDARKSFDRTNPRDADGEVAAAQARVAKLHDTVPSNFKQKAYNDKGGLLSSASKYVSKRLTINAAKAVLNEPRQQAAHDTSQASESGSDAKDANNTTAPAATSARPAVPTIAGCRGIGSAPSAATAGAAVAGSQLGAEREPLAVVSRQAAAAAYTVYPDTVRFSGGSTHRSSTTSRHGSATHRSTSTMASAKTTLQQQQLEMADDLYNKINSFMAQELSVQQHNQQQQARAASPPMQQTPAVSQPDSSATKAPAADTQEDLTQVNRIDLTAEGWTPELMASLAMRFQGYGLPPGVNSMPDVATMIQQVEQQEREEEQKRQQDQQEWMLQQQMKQQAKQQSATRHLQLYQLGVPQQRARLRGVRPRARPAVCEVSAVPQQLPQIQHQMVAQQQHRQPQREPQDHRPHGEGSPHQQQHGQPQQQGPGDSTGSDVEPVLPEQPLCRNTPGQFGQDEPQSQQARASSAAASVNTADAQHTTVAAAQAEQTIENALQDGTQPSSSMDATAANQESVQQGATSPVAQATPPVAALDDVRAAELLRLLQQQSSSPLKPPFSRYKSDVPGVPVGASHGHLSPAGLKFQHLPGSRRQVYAQVQDALACSDAIKLAEQELRGLHYAPSGSTGTGG